jgi:hypothetical protein
MTEITSRERNWRSRLQALAMLRNKRNEVVANSIMVPLQRSGQSETICQEHILARSGFSGSLMAKAKQIDLPQCYDHKRYRRRLVLL